jgi:fructose-1,6-bisphosphatase I
MAWSAELKRINTTRLKRLTDKGFHMSGASDSRKITDICLHRFQMNSTRKVITLDEFIFQRQEDFQFASGDLSSLLRDIGFAAKVVNREVNKAGLVDILGTTGMSNVHGEPVKKLDVFANTQFITALKVSGKCCGIATEEEEDFIPVETPEGEESSYVVLLDPLDGSSNIDVNVSIGTIFSIYRRTSNGNEVTLDDFLQAGNKQVAAGYVIYGSSTMLVYTTGAGVNGFTLDPGIGEFCLSHPGMQTPRTAKTYSINQGNYARFDPGVKSFISWCQEDDEPTGRPYSLRYIGSMVADVHRNLIKGGIFIYPQSTSSPEGKLRLLYECNPMAFIVEQAGGRATTGAQRVLDIEPQALHQRSPIFIGTTSLVEKAESFCRQYARVES